MKKATDAPGLSVFGKDVGKEEMIYNVYTNDIFTI